MAGLETEETRITEMIYKGVVVCCSDVEPGRCLVFFPNGAQTQYFENQAAAEAFVDAALNNDDDGYPD